MQHKEDDQNPTPHATYLSHIPRFDTTLTLVSCQLALMREGLPWIERMRGNCGRKEHKTTDSGFVRFVYGFHALNLGLLVAIRPELLGPQNGAVSVRVALISEVVRVPNKVGARQIVVLFE